jgi:hypothetical protein
MVPIHIPTEAWRKNFRSIVLLAILGVCSAMAWVLAWHKSAPARNAQEILAAIRRRGIKTYWPENARHQQWFLIYRDEKITGWEMEYHQAGSNGAVGGFVRQNDLSTRQVRISTRWRLSNNAEKGDYQSQHVAWNPPQAEVGEAKIELRDRNLQVVQNINGKRYSSSAAAPENYLPEGLMSLAIREVAQRRSHARFEMVQDAQPPAQSKGEKTPLFSFELRYVGQDSHSGGAMVEESYDPKHTWITVLDDAGNVLQRNQGNIKCVPVPHQTVLQHFPAAAEFAGDDETVEL